MKSLGSNLIMIPDPGSSKGSFDSLSVPNSLPGLEGSFDVKYTHMYDYEISTDCMFLGVGDFRLITVITGSAERHNQHWGSEAGIGEPEATEASSRPERTIYSWE